jgi:hypothetical protein
MKNFAIFAAGVMTGWVIRSSFDSYRDLAVRGIAQWYELGDRAKRFVAVEKEYFEDMFAEARALYESRRPHVRVQTRA